MSEIPTKLVDPRRKQIGARLAEERKAAGLDQQQFAERIGNSKRAVAAWEIGESMPTAEFVARFELANVDIQYVITGRRGAALTIDESELINLYKRTPSDKRSVIRMTAEALAVGSPPPQSSYGVHQVFNAKVGHVQSVHEGQVTNHYTLPPEKAKTRGRK